MGEVTVVKSVELALMLCEFREIIVQVHVLVDALETVEFVIDIQGAKVSSAFRHGDANVLSAKVTHVFGFDDDVLGWSQRQRFVSSR